MWLLFMAVKWKRYTKQDPRSVFVCKRAVNKREQAQDLQDCLHVAVIVPAWNPTGYSDKMAVFGSVSSVKCRDMAL
jgi:hypothetical protein